MAFAGLLARWVGEGRVIENAGIIMVDANGKALIAWLIEGLNESP